MQFDGVGSSDQEKITVIGATNRPQEIDPAALRRFVIIFLIKIIYILYRLKEFILDYLHKKLEKNLWKIY